MSASFIAASSQRLVNATAPLPSTGYPFTIGTWASTNTAAATQGTIFCLTDTASTNNYLELRRTTGSATVAATAGGTESNAALVSAFASGTIGLWTFVIVRMISATNRRISGIFPNGTISHNVDATSRAPSSLDAISIGSREASTPTNFWDGRIAELWFTNTDIQADGLQLQNSLLWQLAYDGPFSVPHIAKDIVEYHSFRHDLSSDTFSNDEDFLGIPGLETLTNTNGVTLGAHPPLRYQGKYNWRNTQAFNLQHIFAGMAVTTTPDLFSWGTTWRNRLMMVGHGR